MTNNLNYLIRAESLEEAAALAEAYKVLDGHWTRIPLILNSQEGIFKKSRTPQFNETKLNWEELTEAEKEAITLNGQWNQRILLSYNFTVAAQYAAERSWWLHAWTWIEIPTLTKTVEYQRVQELSNADN